MPALSALAVVLSSTVLGQAAGSGPDASILNPKVQADELTEPLAWRNPVPSYPVQELNPNGEGWVQLGMMVDTHGKPFEITVVGSSGSKFLEHEAIRAMEWARFRPGKLNGKPIESATQFKVIFLRDQPSKGARADFVHNYVKLQGAVQAKDKAAADAALKDLEVRNLYEDAYFGLANYLYAREWGNDAEQLAGLRRAIAFESNAHYLTTPQFQSTLVQCLALEVKLHHYSEAQELWSKILRSGINEGMVSKIRPMMQQIDQLRTAGGPYDIAGLMPDGTWELGLYKNNFRFKVSDGHIAYMKLRCSKGFLRFEFDPAIDYKVNPKYGTCAMELEGEVGTRFTLTQF